MKTRHLPMTIETFHALDRELGWKYEYWDGCAHISPSAASMDCVLAIRPQGPSTADWQPAPITPADRDALIRSYVAAFADGIEYCDWPPERVHADARTSIDGFFSARRGAPLAASRIIRDGPNPASAALAAMLIVETGDRRAFLDLLFVVPGQQRRGLATAMAKSAVQALAELGFESLESRYLLANQTSRAWHHRLGFADRPDAFAARVLLARIRHKLERYQTQGTDDPKILSSLTAQAAHWETEVERLDAEWERNRRSRRRPER